ncbi:Zinc finger protein [Trichinella sp. T8]|nr:Zinc finger protein [Trichinella sp. T8]
MGSLRPDEKTLRMLFCNSLISTVAIPVASLIRSHDITAPYSGYLMEKLTVENGPNLKHVCSYCGKSYAFMSLLRSHERKHTGEKPY